MSPEQNFEEFEGSVRTLGIMHGRHMVSKSIAETPGLKEMSEEELLLHYSGNQFLSRQEIVLSMRLGMVLPSPKYAPWPTDKRVSPDLWNIKVDNEIHEGKTVYILTGYFDVFTGGHWLSVHYANILANLDMVDSNEATKVLGELWALTDNDHMLYLLQKNISEKHEEGTSFRKGVVMARLEPDRYKEEYKGNQTIFSDSYRTGWLEQLPVKWTAVFPTSLNNSKSWEFGNELITGWPDDVVVSERIVFVLPHIPESVGHEEIDNVNKREEQIRSFGFGVARVPSFISDTSSSEIIRKFSLKPIDESQL